MNPRKLTGAVLVASALVLAACSSSDPEVPATSSAPTSASSSSSGGTSSTTNTVVAEAEAAVKEAATFPTTIPVTDPLPSAPPTGKTVLFLQCEQEQCPLEGEGIKAAAAAIGWDVKVLNFEAANPATLVEALRTGLQYKPVAAFFAGVPQDAWKSVQQEYADAGAVIVANYLDKAPTGPGVLPGRGYEADSNLLGTLLANVQIADSQGAAVSSLLVSVPSYTVFNATASTYMADIAEKCPDCTVDTLDVTLPQLFGGQLNAAVISAVKRNADITYIVSVNGAFVAQLPAALKAAGLEGKYKIIAGKGGALDQQNVLDGTMLSTVSSSFIVEGWQDIDLAARHVMGLPIPEGDSLVPTILLTKDNITTPQNTYQLPEDYQEQWKALWQVS